MIYGGVDIGSLSTKAVLMDEDKVLSWSVILTSPDSEKSAREVLLDALKIIDLNMRDINTLVATGYGRINVPFAQSMVTEISCHARGVNWFYPAVRTILDMGGQDCKAIRCNEKGKVLDFIMNDKCAAGTGRYLERVASTVGVKLEEFGPKSLEIIERSCNIKSYCAVFAETDVIMLLRQGVHPNDILAGAADAIVTRIKSLLERVKVEPQFSISGGVAKNIGVVKRLEQIFGLEAQIPFNPQIVGALGAALYARERS